MFDLSKEDMRDIHEREQLRRLEAVHMLEALGYIYDPIRNEWFNSRWTVVGVDE